MPSSGKTQPPRRVSQLQNTLVRNTLASWIHYGGAIASSLVLTPLIISKMSAPAYGVLVLLNQLRVEIAGDRLWRQTVPTLLRWKSPSMLRSNTVLGPLRIGAQP